MSKRMRKMVLVLFRIVLGVTILVAENDILPEMSRLCPRTKKSWLPSPMSSALSCFGSSSFPAAWLQQKKWAPIAHECCIELLWLLVVSCSLAAGNDEEPQQLNAELISDGSPLFFAAARLQKTTRSQSSSMQKTKK